LDSFPDTGIAWPRATIFKVLDDLTGVGVTLDWTIHTTFTSVETAVSVAQNVITNIRDQYRQRGRHADSDDELIRKLASGKELTSELKRGSAERGVNPSIVIAAGAADTEVLNTAVAAVTRVYRRQNIGARRWRGSQTTLWRAFNPGSERSAALGEFRSPTTLRTERHLNALFDESLPVADLSGAAAVVWNTAGLDLPTVGEEYVAHLHDRTTPRQRAGAAIYGLAADLAQAIFFGRPYRPDVLLVEEAAPLTNSPGGQKCCNRIIRQGRKSQTGFVGISQHPMKDFAVLEDEFIDQRLCLAFRDSRLATATLEWCGRDLDRHRELLRAYVENTSPITLIDHGDDTADTRHGTVVRGREGEAWFLDEFGGFGKIGLFAAPTAALAAALDTNPRRSSGLA
jgi:hypothetical protein